MRRAPLALLLALFIVIAGAPLPARAAVSGTQAESMLLGWINKARTDRGLVPLVAWSSLNSVAGYRAGRMASLNTMSHTAPGSLSSQLKAKGVSWYRYGEVIAYSTATWPATSALAIFRLWRGSAPHWALLMSKNFNYIGVGLAYRSSGHKTFSSVVMSESTDHTPASARMVSVSKSGNDLTWTWSGSDRRLQTHTAGLRDFDVQLRVDSGSWTTVRNDTTATSIRLADRPAGHRYSLRVRATDRRGNVGTWTVPSYRDIP